MADDDGIRVLFGPDGYLRLTIYGEAGEHPKQLDLTTFAEPLVRAGIERTRGIARPADIDGFVSCELGDGGRATWPAGGGDITADEVLHAVACTIEQLRDGELGRLLDRWNAHLRRASLERAITILLEEGISRRRINAVLNARRTQLDGRSARAVIEDPDSDITAIRTANTIVCRFILDNATNLTVETIARSGRS
jgi:hypothetical protein